MNGCATHGTAPCLSDVPVDECECDLDHDDHFVCCAAHEERLPCTVAFWRVHFGAAVKRTVTP